MDPRRQTLDQALTNHAHQLLVAVLIGFKEHCAMNPDRLPRHALLLRWGKCELQALGIPAILSVVVVALIGARWLGLF
jgi:hypothetical protein